MIGVVKAALALALLATTARAYSMDAVITKELEEVMKKDEFIISLKHIKPKKRLRGSTETLFSVHFPSSEQKFALLLDRKTKRVAVETFEEQRHRSQHFTVDTLEDDTTIRSLVLAVDQRQPGAHATLYIDCVSYGMVATPKSMRDMFEAAQHGHQLIEVFHEKKYPMEVDGQKDLRMVLTKNECPTQPQETEAGDDLLWEQNDEPQLRDFALGRIPVPDHRADIPIVSNLNDNSILEALNALIKAVNHMNRNVEQQSKVIERLRNILEECDLCHRPAPPPTPPPTPSCRTHPPRCYPSVGCVDTAAGPRCGPCPHGYTGDGTYCERREMCRDRPCFDGSTCEDTPHGYKCGPCPPGYSGDGRQCQRRSNCHPNPCYSGVQCYDVPGEAYRCGPCPDGYTGNGQECSRLPSCADKPCFQGVRCVDNPSGYRCGDCPAGYTGNGRECRLVPCYVNPCAPGNPRY